MRTEKEINIAIARIKELELKFIGYTQYRIALEWILGTDWAPWNDNGDDYDDPEITVDETGKK